MCLSIPALPDRDCSCLSESGRVRLQEGGREGGAAQACSKDAVGSMCHAVPHMLGLDAPHETVSAVCFERLPVRLRVTLWAVHQVDGAVIEDHPRIIDLLLPYHKRM